MACPRFIVDGINYESLVRKLEKRADFSKIKNMDDAFDSVLKAMENMRKELIKTALVTEKKRGCYIDLGCDKPTDLYWILSILFTLRTIGMLHSKSKSTSRSSANKLAHQQLLERFISALKQIYDQRCDLLRIFPPL